jgi:hypothetical protein
MPQPNPRNSTSLAHQNQAKQLKANGIIRLEAKYLFGTTDAFLEE